MHKKESKVKNDFSFLEWSNYFEKLVAGGYRQNVVVENFRDLWAFVKKYENILKRKEELESHEDDEPHKRIKFERRLCTCIGIRTTLDHLIDHCPIYRDERYLTMDRMRQFYEITLLYLDFKQKERFSKLITLRKSQKSLPIFKEKENILQSLEESQVTIIAGDTGCGKSTQLPQYLYENGYRNVVCTQPRRLACVSLSKRVAHEMLSDYGTKVGYQIRFERKRTQFTNICFITEGLVLRQLAMDDNLSGCEVLILDEIHERNLLADILLGIVKCLKRSGQKMKIILMSATLHTDLFKSYFSEEKVSLIRVPGRLYPISVHYKPPPTVEFKRERSSAKTPLSPEPYIQILSLIDQKYPANERGDVLIFMSGVYEIQTIIDAIKDYSEKQGNWIPLPLHSGLSLDEQDKVFHYAPDGMRKCIVSTNIAETSITVDGVRFVIDSGKMKEMSYDSTFKMKRLKEYWISKSSAEQRKGRAGRTGPGVCYRLYSEQDYQNMPDHTTPEVHRVPLDATLLQMIAMGLSDVRLFPFLEAPTKECLEKAIVSLEQHGAITNEEQITPLGTALSTLPVDISIGKILLMGCVFEQLQQVLTLAAILSIQSPFTQRAFTDASCGRERKEYDSSHGEPLTLFNVYRHWLEMKWSKQENTRVWCRRIGIEEQRLYELTKLRNQFQSILEKCQIIQEPSSEGLSSAERTLRFGETKILKKLKRTHEFEVPKTRKIIKLTEEDNTLEDDFDIRDVDFRLSHDAVKFKALMSSASANSHQEVLILKLLIVSGLYPQIAVADEFNSIKSDQFFHTFAKPFVSLHPNGQFANDSESLKLSSADLVEDCGAYTTKLPLSSKHQILCYQELLETTKPYLLNTIRMPAAQTLFLFAATIDTNFAASKIIFDSWLSLEFPTPETGQILLYDAVKIRNLWNKLLNAKLSEMNAEEVTEQTREYAEEQNQLFTELMKFMNKEVLYTIKRLLPADLKEIYTKAWDPSDIPAINPFNRKYEIRPNEAKGGFYVTDNVTYCCVRETPWSLGMEDELKDQKWECPKCSESVAISGIAKLLHFSKCQDKAMSDGEQDEVKAKLPLKPKNAKLFVCSTCNQELVMTQIEFLRHKKDCQQ